MVSPGLMFSTPDSRGPCREGHIDPWPSDVELVRVPRREHRKLGAPKLSPSGRGRDGGFVKFLNLGVGKSAHKCRQ